MSKLIKNKTAAYLISIFCMFLWGSAFPTIKLTYENLNIQSNDYYSMILVAGLRFFLAGIFCLIILIIKDKNRIVEFKSNLGYLIKLSILVISLGYFFFYIGTGNTTGMKSALITSSSTFLVVIFSHFMLNDEKFNIYKLIAIILGLLGVVFSNINKNFDLSFSLIGEGFMLINSILGALGTIYVKRKGARISPYVSSSGQFLLGGAALIIVGLLLNKNVINFNLNAILLIIYGAFISSAAFSLWYTVLSEYKASEVAFLRLFIPFFGTILSFIFLGEKLSFGIVIGLVFVILGILIVNKSEKLRILNVNRQNR